MKFEVYDYRVVQDGRPSMRLCDVPPALEDMVGIWRRNGWVIGVIDDQTDHHVCVAAVDFLSDVILYKQRIESGEDAEILKILLTDSAIITAAQRLAIKEGGETIKFPEEG